MNEALDELRHPLVRDLAWLLHAPDLLATPMAGRPTLAELGLADPQRRRDWLIQLERDPQAIETTAGPSLTGRLGIYHEKLWHFLLANAPNTRLLAHNLTVHDGKRTLGELDLLYAIRDDLQPIHLELAIKYYLGLPEGPGAPSSQARWIGPDGVDSLARKRQRAITHQFPLATRLEAAATLAPFDAPPLAQRLAMPGVLFLPWGLTGGTLSAPVESTKETCFGDWLHISRWPLFCQRAEAPLHGAVLDKPHWLAPPTDDTLVGMPQLTQRLERHFSNRGTPRQLFVKLASGRWQRLFVVADDWPRQIPLSH